MAYLCSPKMEDGRDEGLLVGGEEELDEYQRATPLRRPRMFAFDWGKGFVSPYQPAKVTPARFYNL